nr:uncharacterized protein LOC109623099 isoform X4 [Aedes albopictus]
MPWGCLCSKEKKRPQISSPILKPDETGKHQLLPAVRRPLLGVAPAEKLEQRLLDPNLNELTDRSSAEANGDESSEEFPNGNGPPKRDKLQQQLIQKSKLKSSNLKSTTYTRNTENDKLTRHLNNVKFAFDEPQRQAKPATPAKTAPTEELIKLDDEAASKRGDDQVDHDGNGNYDVLPPPPEVILQIVENADENSNLHLRPPGPPDVVKSSTESIPYIDDEQAQVLRCLNSDPNKVRNFHDARIITLTPKNVGSQAEKLRGPSSPELRQLVQAKLHADGPDITKIRFTHSFHILASGCCDRICQHCHLVLSLDVALRCAVCEFTCHQRCVQLQQSAVALLKWRQRELPGDRATGGKSSKYCSNGRSRRRMDVPPKSRYTDTSYLIFQQLKEGGLQCAFPAIYELLNPGSRPSGRPVPVDELPVGVEPIGEPKNGAGAKKPAIGGQYKAKDSRKAAGSGIPRKQSKVAEKRKNRRSLELKAVEEATREEEDAVSVAKEEGVIGEREDEKKVQVYDLRGVVGGTDVTDSRHVSVISSGDEQGCVVQKDIQVAVDFHHRPNSEVDRPGGLVLLETNNNDIKCKSSNEPADGAVGGEVLSESDVDSVRTVTPGLGSEVPKAPSVQIRRKQYLYEPPYLTGSEYSDTDFTDTASSVGGELDDAAEYARVELRQKNAHEDEQQQLHQQQQQQQQIINSKYNSFPLQQQQQQQTRQTTSSLNHVNNNSIPNGGSHYQQQHNYSSQVHQYQQLQPQQHQYHSIESYQDRGSTALRLSYVTERILASILPARRTIRNGTTTPVPGLFADEHERELIEMLEQKHEKNYRIFDLESCIASISLEKLCELCKHIDSWLGSGKEKIVVLQDREDKQRLGTAIAAYLEYQKICGSNFPQSNRTKALQSPGGGGAPADLSGGRRTPTWLDLDIYSTQKFLESITGPLRIPSHKRYIKYFSGLLSGTIKMNAASLFLRAIIVESPPCLHYRSVTVNSEWRSFVKIYEGVRCLFTSDIYVIPITTRQFIYEIKHPLRLRGDVLIRCYQIIPNNNKLHDEKELISCVQFHTCAITEREVQFAKVELDLACNDERFPADHKVRLCFDTTPNERSAILVFQNPLVRIEPIIEGGDHLETINEDDRHRELDDLLSDMLMTVQGIPDVGRSKGGAPTTTATPATTSAQATHHHHHHHHHLHHHQSSSQQASDHFVNTSTDTIKRSHSAQLPALRESAKERELLLYETSSTTTTLTPPPSESGRETPLLSSAYSTIRDKRDLCLTPTERELLMNLQQHQSFGYPRQARSTTGALERFTSDDDDDHYGVGGGSGSKQIPYHAREDSRPFTYGSIPLTGTPQNPPASTMLKMQSGLSSPSMVRKAIGGTPTSARKSTGMGGGVGSAAAAGLGGRNSEFEEMLRERREKVFSEKYTIGDQSPRGTDTVDNRWNYSTTIRTTVEQQPGDHNTNGYLLHEPLKRSNTMDGSFGRQFSHDGISGQTWLQLQQQKLRARKEQQKREHSNSFSYSYGSPAFPTNASDMPMYSTTHRRSQTLSPVRNERSYHTLTTTHTRTNSTERPFVAVKRAHENAKMQTIGSAPLSVLNASPHGHIAQAQQQQSPPTTVAATAAVTATAPSPSPSMASTTVEQHGSSNASSSSPPINNGHHSHQHHQHHHQQQHEHHVSFDSSTLSQQNGLLSLADQDHSTPKHGHVRLESEQIIFSNIDCLNNLDTSEKLNNLLKDITNSAAAVQRAAKSNGHAPLASIPAAIPAATTSSVVTSTTSNNPSAATSNTFATTTTSSNTTTTINHHHLPNHQARSINNHTHSNHYQNGHRRPPAPEPMDISPTSAQNGPNCLRIGEDPSVLTSSGQLALDKLLASLALENDVTEQHLAKIDQQQQLSAVIANLTEYNLSEAQRLNVYNGNDLGGDAFRTHADIVNGNGFHHHHHHQNPLVNGRTPDPGGLLINNHVRRIASESDSTISSISPSLSERSNAISWCDQAREESFSSYRSETEPDTSPAGGSPRPETPAFPVTPRTPYGLSNGSSSPALPPKSPTSQRKYNSTWSLRSQKSTVSTYDVSKDLFTGSQQRSQHEIINQNDAMSCYTSRRNSTTSNANSEPQEVAPQFVKFARDSSKYWYKPNISREEAIALLRNAPPGTFVVRDSTTFANAYGLVVKVAHPPPGVQSKGPNSEELVRHFLVEPTIRGVRLKGCSNEPVFTSLSALVYQHSITPLALPCRLIIPDTDLQQTDFQSPAQQQLLMQGAACNVLYLFTCDTESLTGPQAIRKAVGLLLSARPLPKPTQVHFKVSIQGITLTDNTRQLFFRRHYPSNNVSFCSLDPDEHRWSIPSTTGDIPSNKRIFAFVAKRSPTSADNQCHVFCELEITQPASAIVSFANKVVLGGTGGQQPAPTRAI